MRRLIRCLVVMVGVSVVVGCSPKPAPMPVVVDVNSANQFRILVPQCEDSRLSEMYFRHAGGVDRGSFLFVRAESAEPQRHWVELVVGDSGVELVAPFEGFREAQAVPFESDPNHDRSNYRFSVLGSGADAFFYLSDLPEPAVFPLLVQGFRPKESEFRISQTSTGDLDRILNTYCDLPAWEVELDSFD